VTAGIQLLLTSGALPDVQDKDGWSPLHLVASRGNQRAVEILLRGGAVASRVDRKGWTPLHHACDRGHAGCIAPLLAAGALPTAMTLGGDGPVHLACRADAADCVRALAAADDKVLINIKSVSFVCQNFQRKHKEHSSSIPFFLLHFVLLPVASSTFTRTAPRIPLRGYSKHLARLEFACTPSWTQ
jgi:ankyrin repeat protein